VGAGCEGRALAGPGYAEQAMTRYLNSAEARHGWKWPVGFAAYFIALWWLGCFYLHGNLGAYSDDWSLAIVDPVTGESQWGLWPFERNYFWRPLLQLFVHYGFLLLWQHLWLFHLLNVTLHAAAALLVYRLMRRLCSSPHGPAAGAFVFLLFPFHYEVIFWSTAMTTGIPTGLWLLLALWFCDYAAQEKRTRWWHIPLAGLFTFMIVCWYEQPGALVGAFPWLYMALRPRGEAMVRSMVRIALVLVACGVGLLTYIILLRYTAPVSVRGGSGSFIGVHEIATRWGEMWPALRWYHTARLSDAFFGGLHTGWLTLSTPLGAAAAGAVAICGGLWLWAWIGEPAEARSVDPAARRERTVRSAWALLFGASAVVCAWVPVFPIRGQSLEPRMSYAAAVGLATLMAVTVDSVLRLAKSVRGGQLLSGAIGLTIAIVAWISSLSLLGWQRSMQVRSQADAQQTRELAALYKDAPPLTVFVAVEDSFRAGTTGRGFFDLVLLSWVATSWSTNPALQHAFRRTDVFATSCNFWVPPPFAEVDEHGFRYISGLPAAAGGLSSLGGCRIEWSRVIPYSVDKDGHIVPIRELVLTRAGMADTVIAPPLAARVTLKPGVINPVRFPSQP